MHEDTVSNNKTRLGGETVLHASVSSSPNYIEWQSFLNLNICSPCRAHCTYSCSKMELILVVMVFLALSYYMVGPCNCTGLCSPATYEFRLSKAGAFHFPVFHQEHPCLDPSPVHPASVSGAGTVIGNDKIHQGKYFMAISLGTPAVFNLVTIDTGCTLSWVNCERCQRRCHKQADEAGPKFNPQSSTTYRQIGCSNEDCIDIHQDNGIPYGCIDERDTCLYSLRYGSQYSAGKLGRDRLALGDITVVDDFVFGCSMDDRFYGSEAGVIGFGNKSYSFFNQMARQTSYNAFAYCFPSDHQAEGFLIIGPYPQRLELVTPLIRGYGLRSYVYSLEFVEFVKKGLLERIWNLPKFRFSDALRVVCVSHHWIMRR
ncbi:hypothetical protein GQ55_3G031900 [Panicum hallii var. hallii]|uniref:Peptidase A1 domain-containing protein n=1 Tax=Panicum hallii var. hallii TaxID=1504633 RepID=A0A2T7E596_9POAL|nr:hypothetical protein GQ55_3G031900 [Panicum hallii var. hallii]